MHYKERTNERGSEIVLELERLLCRELGHDLILSVNTLFNIYSQVPMQPSFMLLIMKNNKGFDK